MSYETLLTKEIPHGIEVTLNRVEKRNAINKKLMQEIHDVLDKAESNPQCKVVVLKGQQGVFCTGMDFDERIQYSMGEIEEEEDHSAIMNLLKRFASTSKIVISVVEGKVIAGGVGIVAASDYVIASPQSTFALSEVVWGLLPANILPFIIRRTSFQKAYTLTMTAETIKAERALAISLIDEMSEEPDQALKLLIHKLSRITGETVFDLKQYFRKLWILDEKMEQTAIEELSRLVKEPRVLNNIKRYVEEQKLPWED